MTKWDTIQADVSDAYTHLDEEEAYNNMLDDEEDVFGFVKAIQIDHFLRALSTALCTGVEIPQILSVSYPHDLNHKNSFATRPKKGSKCQWSMVGY